MSEYTVITQKGQITTPAAVRQALGIKRGDRIEVTVTGEGKPMATIRHVPSVVDSTYGIAKWKDDPVDIAEYSRIVEEELVSETLRELGVQDRAK
jgi:AbrB family looped-hinge helix DNA binding protein